LVAVLGGFRDECGAEYLEKRRQVRSSTLPDLSKDSAPSYDVVYEVVRQVPAGLLTLAHEGKKAYSAAFDLVHRRQAERPNAIWQVDHTLLDILVQRESENPAQPWLTVILDDYSLAVARCFLFFEAPSAAQTALALRQAIWRKDDPRWHVCGIPDVLYTDNGSDFTSQATVT
jgi:putative transposase